jgi:hypothetical protein
MLSALLTPTYFAYVINLPVLFVGSCAVAPGVVLSHANGPADGDVCTNAVAARRLS